MNILEYFGLTEHPYKIGPDPRFLYFSEQVKEALGKCQYLISERTGPIYMYGPIGAGKTSILRRVTEYLAQDKQYIAKLLITPNVKTSNTFLRIILDTFDIKTERSYAQSLKNLENYLLQQHQSNKIPVLLIDEAQNLTRDTLKLIHYLLNFETPIVKLLQIILVGQEELASRILRFKELASRMFPLAMNAMSIRELEEMMKFRWTIAGGAIERYPFVGDDIYKVVFAYTKGLPRDVIKICGEAIADVFIRQEKHITTQEIEGIARGLNLQNLQKD